MMLFTFSSMFIQILRCIRDGPGKGWGRRAGRLTRGPCAAKGRPV
jgi:hypothetical protein